ncbi:MFS transporter [Kitasatospora sp. NPDC059817]|uniref:MFS transporter n=1 Tax=unclassified Kitasatospora TaxID=2633591 RepID=UPI00364F532D
MFIALVVAAVASLGTPLITSVATSFHVSLGSAQWTLTVALLSGAVATPVLGRLGAGPHRRATILATLAVVVAGSALTVLPLPFAWLLAGRAAQGVGLGLTALMMGVARDHLPEERSAAVIALISVVSIIGAGVGYPLAALLAELGGVRAAYGLGLVVTAAALLTAWRSMPEAPEDRSAHVDVASGRCAAPGAVPRRRTESVEPAPRRGGRPRRRRGGAPLRLGRHRAAQHDAPGRCAGGAAPGGRRGEPRHVRRRDRHVPPAHAHHPVRADAARRRLRLRADNLRRRAGPHPVLGAGVRRRQAHASLSPADARPRPTRKSDAPSQHWRFHAQGVLGQRLPHHFRP